MYKYQTVVRLHHTDAGGVLYFANLFVLGHECYEAFLAQGNSIGSIIQQGEFSVPVVHTEADYKKPLKLSEKVTIEMVLSKTGSSSFELSFTFTNESSQVAAEMKTTHVVLQQATRKPAEIPAFLKATLGRL